MIKAIQSALGDKTGALVLVITIIILAIGGSYKLFDSRLEKMEAKGLESLIERHTLSERITILETIHKKDE